MIYAICTKTNSLVESRSVRCPACGETVPEWALQLVRRTS